MITWRLWRLLKHPPRSHPMFLRMNRTTASPLPRHLNISVMSVFVVMICFLSAVIPPFLPFALLLPVIFAVFNGSLYGLVWSARVSRALVHEHEQGTFDILSIAPDGAFGTSWAISTGCIHRRGGFDSLRVFSLEEFCIAWTITLILSAGRWQQYMNSFEGNMALFPVGVLITYSLLLIATFYFNNVQSVLLGTLLGMSVPIYVRNSLDAQIWSIGSYIGLQLATYLFTGFMIGLVLPALFSMSIATEILLAFMGVGIFYLIREIVLTALWRLLLFKLNSQPSEIQQSLGL